MERGRELHDHLQRDTDREAHAGEDPRLDQPDGERGIRSDKDTKLKRGMAYTVNEMRSDLYHFGGYTPADLYECTASEIRGLWNEHFNKK